MVHVVCSSFKLSYQRFHIFLFVMFVDSASNVLFHSTIRPWIVNVSHNQTQKSKRFLFDSPGGVVDDIAVLLLADSTVLALLKQSNDVLIASHFLMRKLQSVVPLPIILTRQFHPNLDIGSSRNQRNDIRTRLEMSPYPDDTAKNMVYIPFLAPSTPSYCTCLLNKFQEYKFQE